MPTTTATAPAKAEVLARRFGAQLEGSGWDVTVTDTPWTARTGPGGEVLSPSKVEWRILARRGNDQVTCAWSTVTEPGAPRTTKYLTGTLRRPLATLERDKQVRLRTIAALNDVIAGRI